jgi:hypothetical protein
MESVGREATVIRPDSWAHWPVYWSGIWVGALAALATALIFGLAAIAVGAHQMAPTIRIVRWGDVGLGTLIFAVAGAFFAGIVGAWVAVKIAGIRRSEPAVLHGAIVWLVGDSDHAAIGGSRCGHLPGELVRIAGWNSGLGYA